MATATLPAVSLYQYLHTVYEPDADYVDGELEERNVGEIEHSDLQGELVAILRNYGKDWGIRAFPEQRVQVSATNYRVPDICVMPRDWKKTSIIQQAPLLCIEIISPEDSFSRVQRRCRDYAEMGVPEIWVFNPYLRTVHVQQQDGTMRIHREGVLRMQNSQVQIDIKSVFGVLDEE